MISTPPPAGANFKLAPQNAPDSEAPLSPKQRGGMVGAEERLAQSSVQVSLSNCASPEACVGRHLGTSDVNCCGPTPAQPSLAPEATPQLPSAHSCIHPSKGRRLEMKSVESQGIRADEVQGLLLRGGV